MTFLASETSIFAGEPVETYEFSRGGEFWRYTSADRDVTISGQVYESTTLQRDSLEGTQDLNKSGLKIKGAENLSVAQQFINSPPSDQINLIIRRFHETDVDRQLVVSWIGRLINVSFVGGGSQLTCEPILTSLNRPGLRRLYQKTCPHVLYGPSCRLEKNNFRTIATAATISGRSVQANEFALLPDGYFDGGFIEYNNNRGSVDKRLILTHVGNTITINSIVSGIAAIAAINAFPGCNRTIATCRTKFSNELNYGGMAHIPTKNPFATRSSIF